MSIKHFIIISSIVWGQATFATDEVKQPTTVEALGVVKLVGSAFNSKVILTHEDVETILCKNEIGRRIGKIPGMTVRVVGSLLEKKNKDGKVASSCFSGQQFIVEKTSSGRPAIVGKLKKDNGVYMIHANDGSTKQLQHVSSGLKELVNKPVILDLNSLSAPPAHQNVYRVVTYSEFPE